VRFLAEANTASCVSAEARAVAARIIVTPRVRLADYVQSPKQAVSFEIAAAEPPQYCTSGVASWTEGALPGWATGADRTCCSASCGTCGGSGCGSRPGGPSKCCTSHINRANRQCDGPEDTACMIPEPDSLLEGCFSSHRVYVTYAGGVCGKGDPVGGLDLTPTSPEATPLDTSKIGTWAQWKPLPRVDRPGAGKNFGTYANVPQVLRYPTGWQGNARSSRSLDYQEEHTLTNDYVVKPGGFCPTNLPVAELPAQFQVHACHAKCAGARTLTAECVGYILGADPDDTEVLCADEEMCQYICSAVDSCVSIDMHKDLPRCYLNAETQCADDYVTPVYMKGPVEFVNHTKFDLQKKVLRTLTGVNSRDTGYSYANLLRFAPITFPTGGEYTLCFCDAKASASSCSNIDDYDVRVGAVHVSGVGCLLADKNLARATCVPQFQGGAGSLRCASESPPEPEIPPADGPPPKCVPPPRPIVTNETSLAPPFVPEVKTAAPTPNPTPSPSAFEPDTFCLFEPEELVGDHTPQGMHRQCQTTAKQSALTSGT